MRTGFDHSDQIGLSQVGAAILPPHLEKIMSTLKKTSRNSKDLRTQMSARQDQLDVLNDVKFELSKIEDGIKHQLIREGQTDLLSVNWSRLSRRV